MLFTSHSYYILLVIISLVLLVIPQRARIVLLLVASYLFYAYGNPTQVPTLILVTLTTFFGGMLISKASNPRIAWWTLWSVVSINMGTLIFLKEFGNLAGELIAPIGVSFFTLQGLSYCIDVYRKDFPAESSLPKIGLFMSFFPQVLSGPIHRARQLIPQFSTARGFCEGDFHVGCKRILWGLFKKVVVADKLALIVNPIYNNPEDYSGWALLSATYLFTIQIYADFSGYTDIAIGGARILGFQLSENFNRPYLAQSLREFWKRWHITLTSWFRDYVYLPLGGNQVNRLRWLFNIALVFVLSGFWHGSGLNFLAWGGIHAAFYSIGVLTAQERKVITEILGLKSKVLSTIRVITTFNLVAFAWIFFRANNLTDGLLITERISASFFELWTSPPMAIDWLSQIIAFDTLQIVAIAAAVVFCVLDFGGLVRRKFLETGGQFVKAGEILILNLILVSLLFLGGIGGSEFLYFNF